MSGSTGSAQFALLAGVTRFPLPPNWDATSNKIEVVATGLGGLGGGGFGGNGSHGGNYAWDVNQPIAAGGMTVNIPPAAQIWWFGNTQTPGCVQAGSASVFYPNGALGGNQGNANNTQFGGGGGGGAGPNGPGGNGGQATTGGPGAGGTGNGGLAPPGQRENPPSWPLVNIGIGGGGAGGDAGIAGGNGNHAGGSGGGGGAGTNIPAGLQGHGVIIVTWQAEVVAPPPPVLEGIAQVIY